MLVESLEHLRAAARENKNTFGARIGLALYEYGKVLRGERKLSYRNLLLIRENFPGLTDEVSVYVKDREASRVKEEA